MRFGAQKGPCACQGHLYSCLNLPVSDANPAFSARFPAAFPVYRELRTGAVGSAACGDTNRGVSGVGGGRELRGRRQAAVAGSGEDASVAATPRLSWEDPRRQSGPARGNAGKHKVLEEGRSPELPEAAPWQKGGIFRSREQPAGCDSPFAGGERCGAGQAGAAGTAPAPRSSLGVLDGLRAEEVGGVGAVRVPELLEWQLAAASCVCVWNQL